MDELIGETSKITNRLDDNISVGSNDVLDGIWASLSCNKDKWKDYSYTIMPFIWSMKFLIVLREIWPT